MKLARIVREAADVIYPPRCALCDGEVEKEYYFCADCESNLSKLSATPVCPCCAAPVGAGGACPYCKGEGIYPLKTVVALGPYRAPLRPLILAIKYRHRWPVAEILADRLLLQPRVRELLDRTDVLVAMPLHWSRQIGRGYNQAQSIAARLARRRKIKLAGAIVRLKKTASQALLRRGDQRAANLRNAFGLISPSSVADKHVTIVDDVLTSASTLKSAARALLGAKPASINAIVLAVADPRRRDFQMI